MLNTGADSRPPESVLHVAVAAIFDERGRVLIARRPTHVHQGGLWEFPGGKVEPGETVREALARELREELGLDVQQARPLIRIRHDYPDKSVLLDVWRVDNFGSETLSVALSIAKKGREGQPLLWVQPHELSDYDFPAANIPIVTAIQLPDYYLVTPNPDDDSPVFLTQLETRLRDGIRLVQLRAKTLSETDYLALAKQCQGLCEQHDAALMLNADPGLVAEVGAAGVHLDSGRLESLSERPDVKWVSASCHSPEQLLQAEKLGADFVMLSPVAATASHPDIVPLGWEQFQVLADLAHCPVYALGGMTPADLQQAFAHGAQGVAAIRALWDV
ncbi:MAG: Nudix family hydrolase [Gammaproteobacteria bacterium]|nr:Nudix family hydrolase [Gammaproteobacteria bacterium]